MIKECALWLGKYPMLFAEDLNDWVTGVSKEYELQEHDTVRLSVDEDTDVAAWCSYELSDDEAWMSPNKLVIIKGIENLKSAQLSELASHFKKAETEYCIALTQASGKVVKPILDILTEDSKTHDFVIPDKPDAAAKWGKEWLRERKVAVSLNALKELAQYAGEERSQFAAGLNALSTVVTDGTLEWEDVRKHAADLGAVKVFDITNAIARGDEEAAVGLVQRLGSTHPLALLKMLENRYRAYLGILGGGTAAAVKLGASSNEYALKMMSKEAKNLGEERAIKSLQVVLEAQRGIKGDSYLSMDDLMNVTMVRLTDQFARRK